MDLNKQKIQDNKINKILVQNFKIIFQHFINKLIAKI